MRFDLRESREFIKDAMGFLVLPIIVVLVFTFVISFQPIANNAMEPLLKQSDVVLTSKLSYKFGDIERGDIVFFKTGNKEHHIRRIIGLPGEKIEFVDNHLIINDKAYDEEYLSDDIVTPNFAFSDICNESLCPNNVIPEDYYFVLGDNREYSLDSRDEEIGLVKKEDINGKIFFRIWPLKRIEKI